MNAMPGERQADPRGAKVVWASGTVGLRYCGPQVLCTSDPTRWASGPAVLLVPARPLPTPLVRSVVELAVVALHDPRQRLGEAQ